MTTLLFATNNAHKLIEVRAVLQGSGIRVQSFAEMGIEEDPVEDGDSFEANALIKAQFGYDRTGLWCIGDDSGLQVDALGGAPGIHSKRFSAVGTASANNALLLKKLENQSHRGAQFCCVLALVHPKGHVFTTGVCHGTIGTAPLGEGGFGYDPLFFPEGFSGQSMAQLTMDEKNAISHRGRAFRELPMMLESV